MVSVEQFVDENDEEQPSVEERQALEHSITLRIDGSTTASENQGNVSVDCEHSSNLNYATRFVQLAWYPLYWLLSFLCFRFKQDPSDEKSEEYSPLHANSPSDCVINVESPCPIYDLQQQNVDTDVDLSQTLDVENPSTTKLIPSEPVVSDDLPTDPADLPQRNHSLPERNQLQTPPRDTGLSVHLKKDGRGAPEEVKHHLDRPPDLSSVSIPSLGNAVTTTDSEKGQLTSLNQKVDICGRNFGRIVPACYDTGTFRKQEDAFSGRRPKAKHVMKPLVNNQNKSTSPDTEKGKVAWAGTTKC